MSYVSITCSILGIAASEDLEYVFDGVQKGVKYSPGRREECTDSFLLAREMLVRDTLGRSSNAVLTTAGKSKGKKDVCFLGEEGRRDLRRGDMTANDNCGRFDLIF